MFKGIYSAIFSVYDENMNVKNDTVKKLVDYHLDNGLKGFYVCGNTGECTVLPNNTRKQMLEAVISANNGRGQIMAHVGAGHLEDVLDLLEHANGLDIDAVASLPPSLQGYYEKDEIVAYYKMLAQKSKHPVYAYITSVLNCDMVEFAKSISQIENIAGIKISIPNYYGFGRVIDYSNCRLNILNGPDETLMCGLIEGADGAIGTTYNMLPRLAVNIYNAFNNGDFSKTRELQFKLNRVIDKLIEGNIAEWKAVMTLMGYDMGYTVFPQKMPNELYLTELKTKLDSVGFFDLI